MRKFDLFDIVRRILATIVCIIIVAALYIMMICAPVLWSSLGQVLQDSVAELDEECHPINGFAVESQN